MPTIYSISHYSQPNIIYIGKTQASLKERLNNHFNSKNTAPINIWISKFKNKRQIKIEPLEICDSENANEAERFWIEQFRVWGFSMLNKNYCDPLHRCTIIISKSGKKYMAPYKSSSYKKSVKKFICQYRKNGSLVATHRDVLTASLASKLNVYTIYRQLQGKTTRPRKFIFKYAA